MFGDENQNKLTITNAMKIAIVDSEGSNNDLYTMIFDTISKDFIDKLKISYIYHISDLYKNISQNLEEKSAGLLNTQWIEEISTIRPSIIILYYYIKEGSTKEEEEINISKIIDNILLNDKYVYIYLFIMVSPQEYEIYQHLKDDEKSPNAIRKKLSKDFIYVFASKEIWKTIELSKLCNNLIICSRNYYKQLKEDIKNKKNESMHTEEIIKYDIMLGILSTIKSKKEEACVSKHLKEAYDIICSKSFNHKKYLYGKPETPKENFYEIKAIADWLLFKIMKLNFKITENTIENKKKQKIVTKQKNLDVKSKIDIFFNHIRIFSSFDYGDKEGDTFYFYRLLWNYKRYINIIQFFEKNINEFKEEKRYIYKIGLINFNIVYTFIKMIKFYKKYFKDIDMTKVIVTDKEVSISNINTLSNIYYAKPPEFFYEDPNTGEKEIIGFNDDIHLKKEILNNDLTLDKMFHKLKDELIPNILLFFYKTSVLGKEINISDNLKDFITLNKQSLLTENYMKGLEIYLNNLRLNILKEDLIESDLCKYPDINDTMFELYKSFDKFENIKKYPKIYVHFLNKITENLIDQMENTKENEIFSNLKKTSLFKSLSILASIKLLNEKEEDIFNKLLNDDTFIPVNYKVNILQENYIFNEKIANKNTINENVKEKNEIQNEKENNYNKKDYIIFKINSYNRIYNSNKNKSISFDYNIKDIEKSQERNILDLVEYQFKFEIQLEKIKLKFDNIKIFFECINEEKNELNNNIKKEIIVKEFTKEELENYELSKDNPLILKHKIFLKYKRGKIYATKILATLSQKKSIIYLFEIPDEFKKVIFIKNLTKNVLNFDYIKKHKVGNNQYSLFEINVAKEKIDEVEIKNLSIELENIPTFMSKDFSIISKPKTKIPSEREQTVSEQFDHYSTNSLTLIQRRPSVKKGKEKKNPDDLEIMEKSNLGNDMMNQLDNYDNSLVYPPNYKINNNKINNNEINNNEIYNNNNYKGEKTHSGSIHKKNKICRSKNINQKRILPEPEYYIYNNVNNNLDKYIDKIKINYNNFETLLNQGKNKYSILLKFIQEGSYKIKLTIIYYIRHKEIEDYIEYREESILDFNVINTFSELNEIYSNNFILIEQKHLMFKKNIDQKEKEQKIYLTNNKIGMDIILNNKIDEDIQIKDIQFEIKKGDSLKYFNSYINDLIHLYDLDEEEKKEMLIIKQNSSYIIPFETEFKKAFIGSIGKMNIIWTTKQIEQFENGKLNLLNKDEFEFPEIEVKPLDLEYNYKTEKSGNNEILFSLRIKNITNKSKQIVVTIENNKKNNDNFFIILGLTKQIYLIKEREVININLILIPTGRGEHNYPYIKIIEKDLTREKTYTNYYYSEKLEII